MITAIKTHTLLNNFTTNDCFENNVGATYAADITPDDHVTLDIDKFYHSISLPQVPEISDRLVVVKCIFESEGFAIYILEMKNIGRPRGFSKENIYGKFKTSIDDFMKSRHAQIFMDPKYKIKNVLLYFITDAYKFKNKGFTDNEIEKALKGTKLDVLLSMPPFEFRGKYYAIQYKLPNPTIKKL